MLHPFFVAEGPLHRHRFRLLEQAVKQLMIGGRVLDVGAGTGGLALRLARRGFHVVALDWSLSFVQQTSHRMQEAGLSASVASVVGDAAHLGLTSATFDGVVCGEVLEHLTDDLAAVLEFNRVLKAGGWCLITVPLDEGEWRVEDQWGGHRRRHTKRALVQLFEQGGFAVEGVVQWGFPLARLYRRFFFGRLMRWSVHGSPTFWSRLVLALGQHSTVASLLALAFRLDRLFSDQHRGVGLLLQARKGLDEPLFKGEYRP